MKTVYVFLIIFIISSTSCLQQKIDRQTTDLAQTWEVTKKELNGANDTGNFEAVYADYTIYFSENGNFSEAYTVLGLPVSVAGSWLFLNNGKQIKLIDSFQTRIFEIIELNGASLIVQLTGVPDNEVYYLEPN